MPPTLSVVIPTYRRAARLGGALEALNRQTLAPETYELIVADDGSGDDTLARLETLRPRLRPRLVVVTGPHGGPAAARNRGLAHAQGRLVLFLDDDVVAAPGLLAEHRRRHEAQRGIAVLGRVAWAPAPPPTPFMRFLAPRGPLFHYHTIRDPEAVRFTHFYTLNLSLERRWFEMERFDEAFPIAAFEDLELGYRLCRRGLRIVFEPSALAYHDHPYTPEDFWRRMEAAGASAAILLDKHPELRREYLPWGLPTAGRCLAGIARLEALGARLGRPWWWAKTVYHYTRGARGVHHVA